MQEQIKQQLLQQFNQDYHTKEVVTEFLTDYLEERIIENAMQKKPVEGLADAIIELNNAFDELSRAYDTKQTTTKRGDTNNSK